MASRPKIVVTQETVDSVEQKFKEIEPDLRQKKPSALQLVKQLFEQITQMWEHPKLPPQLEVRVDELHERINQTCAAISYLGPIESAEDAQQREIDDFNSRQKEVKKILHPSAEPTDDTQYGPRRSMGQLKQANLFSVSPSPASRTPKRQKTSAKKPSTAKTSTKSKTESKLEQNTPLKTNFPFNKSTPRFIRFGSAARHPARKSSLTPASNTTTKLDKTDTKLIVAQNLNQDFDLNFDVFETPTNTPKLRGVPPVSLHSKRKKRKPSSVFTHDVIPDAKKKLDVFSFSLDPAFDPYQ